MSSSLTRPGVQLALLLSTALLGGCLQSDNGDLMLYIDEVKARKEGRIEPLPEIKQIETFVYNRLEDRDPFLQIDQGGEEEQERIDNGISPDFNRRKEELENFSLDSLRMVGTLEQVDDVMWALIRTNDNTIYRVKAGNYLGQNHGHITRIGESKIELTEIVSDGQGGYREREASLALKE